ncbi:MAG TPA: alpha/beta hydrolase, partial [Rhizomicrobium sp.]
MTLFADAADGIRLAYDIVGDGPLDIVLVHGFASSRVQNWRDPGWYETLTKAGCRVVAMDVRGHGESGKPHDPQAYLDLPGDVLAVMDAAGVAAAPVMGYSMGGMVAIRLLLRHPERVTALVVGGVGETYVTRGRDADSVRRAMIAEALLAPDPAAIASPTGRGFRAFVDQPGKDRLALAACMQAPSSVLPREALAGARRPVLVVCGEKDELTGAPDGLADAFPGGRAVTVPRRDHMTAVGDKVYKDA